MSWIFYILSITLQVAGALMLIIFAFSTKRKDVIRSFAKSHMIVRDGKTKELSYNHGAFKETYKTAYYTKVSVAFIAAGYIIGVFGNVGENSKWLTAGIIVLAMVILILTTKVVVEKLVKKADKPITNEELEAVGAEPDMESMSPEVIDGILDLGGINLREKK